MQSDDYTAADELVEALKQNLYKLVAINDEMPEVGVTLAYGSKAEMTALQAKLSVVLVEPFINLVVGEAAFNLAK
jgi:hypothetical protein